MTSKFIAIRLFQLGKMDNKFSLIVILLVCTTQVFVSSHILVGRNVEATRDNYNRGIRENTRHRTGRYKMRTAEMDEARERHLSKRLRKILAWIIADAIRGCEDQ